MKMILLNETCKYHKYVFATRQKNPIGSLGTREMLVHKHMSPLQQSVPFIKKKKDLVN